MSLSPELKDKLIIEVARLYSEGRRQTEVLHTISEQFQVKLNSMQVSRLLKEAKDRRILEVRNMFYPPQQYHLQKKLVAAFSCLKEALVVPVGQELKFQISMLGQYASRYLDDVLMHHGNVVIGLGAGRTIRSMVNALETRPRDIDIVPTSLVGWGPQMPEHVDQMALISALWERSGSQPQRAFYVSLPPFEPTVGSEVDAFKTRPKVKRVWEMMNRIDLLFATVGPIEYSVGYEKGRAQERTMRQMLSESGLGSDWLRSHHVVGDMCYSLYDREGEPVAQDLFLTLGVSRFKDMAQLYPEKKVIIIGGKHKEAAIRAALKGHLCNVLITDETTAGWLLEGTDKK